MQGKDATSPNSRYAVRLRSLKCSASPRTSFIRKTLGEMHPTKPETHIKVDTFTVGMTEVLR